MAIALLFAGILLQGFSVAMAIKLPGRHDGFSSLPGNPNNRHKDWTKRIEIENTIASKLTSSKLQSQQPPSPQSPLPSPMPPSSPKWAPPSPSNASTVWRRDLISYIWIPNALLKHDQLLDHGKASSQFWCHCMLWDVWLQVSGASAHEDEARRQMSRDMHSLRVSMQTLWVGERAVQRPF